MQSHYEINVSLKGVGHIFATAPRSLVTLDQMKVAKEYLDRAFPVAQGFKVDVTYMKCVGYEVELYRYQGGSTPTGVITSDNLLLKEAEDLKKTHGGGEIIPMDKVDVMTPQNEHVCEPTAFKVEPSALFEAKVTTPVRKGVDQIIFEGQKKLAEFVAAACSEYSKTHQIPNLML